MDELKSYGAENVINGTWGEAWINGEYAAETTALQAEVDFTKSDVNICRRLAKSSKVTGYEGKGTIKFNKVCSRMIKLLSENMKKGKQTKFTIISKLADPDAFGAERIVLKDVIFDKLTLVDWEAKKNGEESYAFTFSDWELLDLI